MRLERRYFRQRRVLSFLSSCHGGGCRSNSTAHPCPQFVKFGVVVGFHPVLPFLEYGPATARPTRDKGAGVAGRSIATHPCGAWGASGIAISSSRSWPSLQPPAKRCERRAPAILYFGLPFMVGAVQTFAFREKDNGVPVTRRRERSGTCTAARAKTLANPHCSLPLR